MHRSSSCKPALKPAPLESVHLMDSQSPHLLLRVPTPKQETLSFCDGTPRDLKRWIAGLPKANIGETARQLYQCLVELNQLLTPSENRLQLLELLRPEVYYVCKHLERHFLNQSIVLEERPRKVANLCQALQNHLAVGYKLIVSRLADQTGKERTQLLSLALQRAIHCLNGPLIRASQLYCPVPEGLWLELHQLYQIALRYQLQRVQIKDPLAIHTHALSIEQTYIVALLIGCSRCNQMRQNNIARLAEVLEPWSALVRLQEAAAPSSLFAVAPLVDGPPRYKTLFEEKQLPHLLGIDPLPLVVAIQEYLDLSSEQQAQSRLAVPEGLSQDLMQHLAAAWGDISERTFQRTAGQGTLTLSIGMSALHYFLSGKKSFSDILKRPVVSKSASYEIDNSTGSGDVWAKAQDAQIVDWEGGLPYEEIQYERPETEGGEPVSNANESFPSYPLPIINHSPGGYCLAWPKDVPTQLQAGEMVGIQDTPNQGWSVAVVRWIRQVRSGGTQMGIELIAPYAQPCGLQLVRKTEQSSQYLRVLLLPEISAISRPASLLAPRLPFQEGSKVMINISGEERRALLTKKLASTASFNQFEYRTVEIGPTNDTSASGPSGNALKDGGNTDEDFDSLWKSL